MRLALYWCFLFFFNDTATTEIYTLSLHDALPIWPRYRVSNSALSQPLPTYSDGSMVKKLNPAAAVLSTCSGCLRWSESRSEEHTSELQSQSNLVCRLLLEKKNKHHTSPFSRQLRL